MRLDSKSMPDHPEFDPSTISPETSFKFTTIVNKIKELDAEDMRTHGTLFKHFIFTDIRESAYGVKALASFMIAAGFDLRMTLQEKQIKRGGIMIQTQTGDTVYVRKPSVPNGSNGFALLQSLPLWKNPLSVATKKEILKSYNSRPDNVHGEQLRIIILDSKFKEGIDLFDVKYVHLVEPAIATSDLKQAVGRATRFCGQKGLHFAPRRGWPLHVYVYNTKLPNRAPFQLDDAEHVDAHTLMMEKSGLDLALLNLTKELTILAIQSAVDYDLNYKINNFKIAEALLDAHEIVLEVPTVGGVRVHAVENMTSERILECARRKSALFPYTVAQMRKVAQDMKLPIPKQAKRETFCRMLHTHPEYLKQLLTSVKAPVEKTPPPTSLSTVPFPEPAPSIQSLKKSLADLKHLSADDFQREVSAMYSKYKWQSPVVKNGCTTIAAGQYGKPVTFTQTQDFIRHYLTPESPFKGLLAWHSVGTGKTCMAVAAATSYFERAGYTILWVTRNSLMSDIYKNIFGSVCSIPIMESGTEIPSDLSKAKRMLSRMWMPPVSYRTFQNALEKKNELGRMLYKKNPADPLHKTFLIMDEVHKLQDGDLSPAEAADFATIQSYIHKSYTASEDDSVRPLLMTATPITDTPRELFEILNTLIPRKNDRLMEFNVFRETYTNEKGEILPDGVEYFKTRAKGLVSYLNREFDPTTFSQPVFHTIPVHLPDRLPPSLDALVDKCMVNKSVVQSIKNIKNMEGKPLDAYITESFVEQDCSSGFEKELGQIDDRITETEKAILTVGTNAERRKELKQDLKDLKTLFATTKKNQQERKRQCQLANKDAETVMKYLAKLAAKKQKHTSNVDASYIKCYDDEKAAFEKPTQLDALEACFRGKTRKINRKFVDKKAFMKAIHERSKPTNPSLQE